VERERVVDTELMKQFLTILTMLPASLILLRAAGSFPSPQSNHLGAALPNAATFCVFYSAFNDTRSGSNETWMTQLKKTYLDSKQINGNSRYEIESAGEEALKAAVPVSHPLQLRSIPATPQ
jgi:hypothetical protein